MHYQLLNETEEKSNDHIIEMPSTSTQIQGVLLGQDDLILNQCLTDIENIEKLLKSKIRYHSFFKPEANEAKAAIILFGLSILIGSLSAINIGSDKGLDDFIGWYMLVCSIGLAFVTIVNIAKFYTNRNDIPATRFNPLYEIYDSLTPEESLTIQTKLTRHGFNDLDIDENSNGIHIKVAIQEIGTLKKPFKDAVDSNKKLKIGLFENLSNDLPDVANELIYDYAMQIPSRS